MSANGFFYFCRFRIEWQTLYVHFNALSRIAYLNYGSISGAEQKETRYSIEHYAHNNNSISETKWFLSSFPMPMRAVFPANSIVFVYISFSFMSQQSTTQWTTSFSLLDRLRKKFNKLVVSCLHARHPQKSLLLDATHNTIHFSSETKKCHFSDETKSDVKYNSEFALLWVSTVYYVDVVSF